MLFLHRYLSDFNNFGCFEKPSYETFGYNAFAHLFLWKIMMGRGRFFAIQYFYFDKILKNINFVGNLSNRRLSLRQNYSVHNPVPKLIFSQKMWANTLTFRSKIGKSHRNSVGDQAHPRSWAVKCSIWGECDSTKSLFIPWTLGYVFNYGSLEPRGWLLSHSIRSNENQFINIHNACS